MFYCECSKGSPKAVCLRSLKNRSLLSVNEDFEGKRNAKNLCKRVKCKVYFVILQRVQPNLGNQIHFLVIFIMILWQFIGILSLQAVQSFKELFPVIGKGVQYRLKTVISPFVFMHAFYSLA